MTIHPALVHFPIALLTVYGVFELARWKSLKDSRSWQDTKAILVVAGWLSAIVAYLTGDAIEHQFATGPAMRAAIHAHQNGAITIILVFGVLAGANLCTLINRTLSTSRITRWKWWSTAVALSSRILSGPIAIPLALVGLVAVTVTGALGGGIALGKDVDPIVQMTYRLLGL